MIKNTDISNEHNKLFIFGYTTGKEIIQVVSPENATSHNSLLQ
jgi:hypothetical protein